MDLTETHLVEPVCEILRLVFLHDHHLFHASLAGEHECGNIYYPSLRCLFQTSGNRINLRSCRGPLFPTPLQTPPNLVCKPQFLRIPWSGWSLVFENNLTSQLCLSSSCKRRRSGEHLVLVRPCHWGRRTNNHFIDSHGQCIDVTFNRGSAESTIRGQKLWCGPIDRCPCQREGVEYDCVQAEVPEKSSWRFIITYQDI